MHPAARSPAHFLPTGARTPPELSYEAEAGVARALGLHSGTT